MTFDEWFSDIGQRTQAFNAKQWAKAGWDAHKIHSDCPIDGGYIIDPEDCLPDIESPEGWEENK